MLFGGIQRTDEQVKGFGPDYVRDIIRMVKSDSVIVGANRARKQHLMISQTTVQYDKRDMGKLMHHAFSEYWTRYLDDIDTWVVAFGLVLYVERTVRIPAVKDDLRALKYGKLTKDEKFVDIVIPETLPLDMMVRARMRRRKYRDDIIVVTEDGQEIDKNVKVYVENMPEWSTGIFISDAGCLLDDWRELEREKILHHTASIIMLHPITYVHYPDKEGIATVTELRASAVNEGDHIIIGKRGAVYRNANMGDQVEVSSYADVSDTLFEKKKLVEKKNLITHLPKGASIATNGPMPQYVGNILQKQELFDQRVSLVMFVDIGYIRPLSSGRQSAASVGSDDYKRLKDNVALIAQSRTRIIKHVWCDMYKEDEIGKLMIDIPVSTNVTLPMIREMFELGFIHPEAAREEAVTKIAGFNKHALEKHGKPPRIIMPEKRVKTHHHQ
jgi:hypothetical protein